MNLNQIENDFVEFLSKYRNRNKEEIENLYNLTKNRFKFYSQEYRELLDKTYGLNRLIYDDIDEEHLIETYKFHNLTHLLRYISYSYSDDYLIHELILKKSMQVKKFLLMIKNEVNKLIRNLLKSNAMRKRIFNRPNSPLEHKTNAKLIIKSINNKPIVVDYGCGMAYTSFEIGKLESKSKIYLVDIDSLMLNFSEFRFKKYDINIEIIRVNENNIYPKLPPHNICITRSVFEHLLDPLKVYQNIYNSLEQGGVLYGNFEDHKRESLHVSPNLKNIRDKIRKDFEKNGQLWYKK